MEDLRKIVIKEGFHDKPIMFLKYSGFRDEDGWEKIGESYTLKGAYDFARQNPNKFEFVCDWDIERAFVLEKKKRIYDSAEQARKYHKEAS